MSEQATNELSRRHLLKKGAVAGAVAWTVPMIASSPAFAATGQCSGSRPCKTYYYVNSSGGPLTGGSGGGGGGGNCANIPHSSLRCSPTDGSTFSTSGGNAFVSVASFSSTFVQFNFSAGTVPLFFEVKYATNCSRYRYDPGTNSMVFVSAVGTHQTMTVTASGSIAGGLSISVSKPDGQGISNVGAYLCR